MICTELYFSSFLKMICMVRQRRGQPGEGRASRELCTFYIFVLCTALLILHPIMLLLEPICKKLLQIFICVYVNNTIQKQESGKLCSNAHFSLSCSLFYFCFSPSFYFEISCWLSLWASISFWFMSALILQQSSEGYRSILFIRYVALPSKLGVSLQR